MNRLPLSLEPYDIGVTLLHVFVLSMIVGYQSKQTTGIYAVGLHKQAPLYPQLVRLCFPRASSQAA